MGSYYGALLARGGHRVTLVARGRHLEALQEAGQVTVREHNGPDWTVPVEAVAQPTAGSYDLAIVTTKSHDTLAAASALAVALDPAVPVLSLQNGVENAGRLADALGPRVIAGLAFVGLRINEPGIVDHQAQGWTVIGDPAGGPTPLSREVFALLDPHWEVRLSDDIVLDQWSKLLWNVGFNTMCAITGSTAGELLATPESAALVRKAMQEVVAVAHARGIALTDAHVEAMAADDPQLRDYRPSTAQDIDAGKRVERDALSAFVVRQGIEWNVPTPVNHVLDGLLALQDERRQRSAPHS
jgi:2-dehydropantoate 2-reductase